MVIITEGIELSPSKYITVPYRTLLRQYLSRKAVIVWNYCATIIVVAVTLRLCSGYIGLFPTYFALACHLLRKI